MDNHSISPIKSLSPAPVRAGPPQLEQVVGVRLRHRRRTLGLEVAVLAAQVGVKVDALKLYEAGGARVPAATLHALSEALGVPLHHFFLPRGATPSDAAQTPPAASTGFDSDVEALVAAYSRITDRSLQRAILAGLQALAYDQD